ncbi:MULTISPECIES: amidase [unclassified Variovorax]|uniref:amidase n=1 Tax=unclassified Variovorax TaxID=663243 RepID=UPI00076CDACF|nr:MULTISPECIES: amidase [unclassified Variovorax]KWT96837.1 Aspartyl-tRNA(Asn) amidotransferase subunit A Glutamyl-tRNA(Gln) amidotransferase subunit A [Variovorax sp. WDL1]PNG58776.1 Acylamidase [Variovorax sp. B4]PNG61434.1 Acylamidase [Variovorax sp. B2]VTV12554.1 Glutamyl-tRNA(Gln) amidotransferase subunit A [Variovorax sp. WDL1]
MTSITPLWQLTATQLAAGFREGAFTPAQALEACLARSAEVNPRLNALVALDAEGATHAAEQSSARWRSGHALGPLDGVPVTIKDNLQVRGLPTHWGSRALAGLVAERDELPVAKLREAGAVIFGKTNVPEFTMQGYTGNPVFGATGNPWDPALTPGGSSGGAVALVAAGGCPMALATDGGGSIRRPASHTNLVGLKPSRGRVPRGGGLPPIFLDFEVAGPLARCVDDVAAMMQVIGRGGMQPVAAAPARILYIPRFGDHPVDPAIAALTAAAARQFAALGHEVTTADRFDMAEAVNERWPLLSQVGLAWLVAHPQALSSTRALDPASFGPVMQANAQTGRDASALALFDLLFEAERLRTELAGLFERHDFLLTPAAAALPWPAGETHPPRIDDCEVGPRGHAVFAGFVNAAGLPAIALPCGFAQGLPVGLQLVAREGGDDALLDLARAFERAHPWQRFPEL